MVPQNMKFLNKFCVSFLFFFFFFTVMEPDIEELRRLISLMKEMNRKLRDARYPGRYVIRGGVLRYLPERPDIEERERSTSPEIPVPPRREN